MTRDRKDRVFLVDFDKSDRRKEICSISYIGRVDKKDELIEYNFNETTIRISIERIKV